MCIACTRWTIIVPFTYKKHRERKRKQTKTKKKRNKMKIFVTHCAKVRHESSANGGTNEREREREREKESGLGLINDQDFPRAFHFFFFSRIEKNELCLSFSRSSVAPVTRAYVWSRVQFSRFARFFRRRRIVAIPFSSFRFIFAFRIAAIECSV